MFTQYKASVLCQSECACLHKTVNMVVFFVKNIENTYPKGRALMQMYRVISKTKRGNWLHSGTHLFGSQVKVWLQSNMA